LEGQLQLLFTVLMVTETAFSTAHLFVMHSSI